MQAGNRARIDGLLIKSFLVAVRRYVLSCLKLFRILRDCLGVYDDIKHEEFGTQGRNRARQEWRIVSETPFIKVLCTSPNSLSTASRPRVNPPSGLRGAGTTLKVSERSCFRLSRPLGRLWRGFLRLAFDRRTKQNHSVELCL